MDVAEEETAEVEWEEEEEDWEGETEEEQEEEPEEEQEEEHEEDYQTKGICSFISEDVSQLLYYSVTVFKWMEKTRTTNGNLKRNLHVEQKDEYDAKCTSTIERV